MVGENLVMREAVYNLTPKPEQVDNNDDRLTWPSQGDTLEGHLS